MIAPTSGRGAWIEGAVLVAPVVVWIAAVVVA